MIFGVTNTSPFNLLRTAFSARQAEQSTSNAVVSLRNGDTSLDEFTSALAARRAQRGTLAGAIDEYIASTRNDTNATSQPDSAATPPATEETPPATEESESVTETMTGESSLEENAGAWPLTLDQVDARYQVQMRQQFKFFNNLPERMVFLPGGIGQNPISTTAPEEGHRLSNLNMENARIFSHQDSMKLLNVGMMALSAGKGATLAAALPVEWEEGVEPPTRQKGEAQAEYAAAANAERDALDQRITDLLASAGLELAEEEALNFSVALNGRITLDAETMDEEKAAAIEQALNSDALLGRELLVNHAKQALAVREATDAFETDATMSRIVAAEILRGKTGLELADVGFDAEKQQFVDGNGKALDQEVTKDYMAFHGLYNSLVRQDDGSYVMDGSLAISFSYGTSLLAGA